ncbi:MAG: NAD-dependent epimerase/dehydratase family protein [Planctomycetota bacterium]|nr:MAG: NAD-dependent epimerase/dehydratase family protein [Planctomycetota bacterium]
MTRILVTGAAGFIGYHLARRLSEQPDARLVLVDNFIRGEQDELYGQLCDKPNVEAYDIDLADPAAVAALPDDVDVIYHEAALNGTQNFYERPYEVLRCGTLPTFYLIDKYVRSGRLQRFVFAGTPESYASTVSRFDWEVPTDESVPLCVDDVFNERWSYAAAKIHGEILTVNACRQFDTAFSIVRYHNVYGPRMGDKHVVPDFLNRMKHGVAELYGHADTRAFLYVDDAVEATLRVGQSPATVGEVVNVGGQDEWTILELARRLMTLLGRDPEDIVKHPSPAGSVRRRAPSIEKLQKLTGFQARWSLDDGLMETIRFYVPELLPAAV